MWEGNLRYYLTVLVTALHLQVTKAALCSGTTTESALPEHQVIRSPNYPNGYFNNELCRWEISVKNPEYEVVRFRIQNTNIRYSPICSEDYVEIRDGKTSWSRSIRRYCGERQEEPAVTSTSDGIFVTFRSDGQYTDLGFELEFWSVPKGLIVVEEVRFQSVNYILFALFGLILIAIVLGLVFIVLARLRVKKLAEKASLDRIQQFAVHIDQNGVKDDNTNGQKKAGDVQPLKNEGEVGNVNSGNGGLEPGDDRSKKRESANNGSTTQVMRLEPALGSAQ